MVVESAKEIGDVMAAMLRKLRGMTVVLPRDCDVAEELARRWDVASAALKPAAAGDGAEATVVSER